MTRRGMTLIEILVAASVLLLLLGLVYQILSPAMNTYQKVRADTEAQQSALVSVERAFKQVWLSTPGSVSITSDGQAMSFLNSTQADGRLPPIGLELLQPTGRDTAPVIWRRVGLFWYDPASRSLLYKHAPYPGGSEVRRMPESVMDEVIGDKSWPATRVAKDLVAVSFSMPTAGTVQVEVAAMQEWRGDRRETRTRIEIMPRI